MLVPSGKGLIMLCEILTVICIRTIRGTALVHIIDTVFLYNFFYYIRTLVFLYNSIGRN